MSQQANKQSAADQADIIAKRAMAVCTNLWRPVGELIDGVRHGSLPWHYCFGAGILLQVVIAFHWDLVFLRWLHFGWLYPSSTRVHRIYYWLTVFSPFLLWGVYKAALKQHFLRELTRVFADIRLKNGRGFPSKFVFDYALDQLTRKLRLQRNGIPFEEFQKRRAEIEGALQVYIDELREDRGKGTLDVIYSSHPMPEEYKPDTYEGLGRTRFLVGTTRSKHYEDDLARTPHLLVGGQTGGGKSTFLRQLVTSLYLNNTQMEFTLIDLKGGLEFYLFENLPRVKVIGEFTKAIFKLTTFIDAINQRMEIIKANRCKDIDEYLKLAPEKRAIPNGIPKNISLHRHLIVVDEAAELFLAGTNSPGKEVQEARRILSQISRQGRAIGIHIVIATQRPDSRALDPQIKANLTGVLCFQMANDASSITVLGNGRATDLPPIPGRAIWKNTSEMVEVQTPHLTVAETEGLLAPFVIPPAKPVDDEKRPEQPAEELPEITSHNQET